MSATGMIPTVTADTTGYSLRREHRTARDRYWKARELYLQELRRSRHLTALDAALDAAMSTGDTAGIPDLRGDAELPSPMGRGLLTATAVHTAVDLFTAGTPGPLVLMRGTIREHRDRAAAAAQHHHALTEQARAAVEDITRRARSAGILIPWG